MKRTQTVNDQNGSPKKRLLENNNRRCQSSVFCCRNIENFDKSFPFFRKPIEVGCFSCNIELKFENSKSQLRHYIQPENVNCVHFDLKKGYHSMIKKDKTKKENIDPILHWIGINKDKFALKGTAVKSERNLHTDFICWRGLLTTLLCTPYENREGWLIAVSLYNGTYYLCAFDTEEKKKQDESRTDRDEEMCCWGWKFEQYLTAESQDQQPDTDLPYNNIEAFCTVVRSRLNEHSFAFCGEVDAIHESKQFGRHYVELKTNREFSHPRQLTNFKRFKLIKWWAQSFLVGIPEIICGFRDDDGIVHRLESFSTLKIPEMVKAVPNSWKPNICFNFLDQFLSYIKKTVTVDDYRTVHLLQWNPGEDVTCRRQPEDSEYRFLPDWFINHAK